MKILNRTQAKKWGLVAMVAVLLSQTVAGVTCYQQDMLTLLSSIGFFILPPLLPAIVAWLFLNPLRAVVGCVFFVPWLLLAYYIDCIAPYEGGGASMVFVVVLFGGFVTSLLGVLLGAWVMRKFGIVVTMN
ncbi:MULTISPECIES: hypothetical protein [Vitreoscilla]|uniref:Inner membrane protein n=1 Tax=Vitreoscilla stercoraria TaxID=61 RepID=A0ABY4EBD0_VITST|nr:MULTISPECIES: hypothetical protein [Vitreoscilla]AUZ06028.1 hypothetical protein ADP71_27600 [Vitreoscilla sp. C1]UOO92601.1 hypothetical protein LVJ81_00695 [Vitreoscilla stercoraria]